MAPVSRINNDPRDWEVRKTFDPHYSHPPTTRSPARTCPTAHSSPLFRLGCDLGCARGVPRRFGEARARRARHGGFDFQSFFHVDDLDDLDDLHEHDDDALDHQRDEPVKSLDPIDHDHDHDETRTHDDHPDDGAGDDDHGVHHYALWSSHLRLVTP
jgi:hypothetical protein